MKEIRYIAYVLSLGLLISGVIIALITQTLLYGFVLWGVSTLLFLIGYISDVRIKSELKKDAWEIVEPGIARMIMEKQKKSYN